MRPRMAIVDYDNPATLVGPGGDEIARFDTAAEAILHVAEQMAETSGVVLRTLRGELDEDEIFDAYDHDYFPLPRGNGEEPALCIPGLADDPFDPADGEGEDAEDGTPQGQPAPAGVEIASGRADWFRNRVLGALMPRG